MRFARSPYPVSNVIDVWECDLMNIPAYGKYKDKHRYILSVRDVFLKISTYDRSKDKERAFRCLGVSVHNR